MVKHSFIAAAASLLFGFGVKGSDAYNKFTMTWITPNPIENPTEAPTYEFPTEAPASIQSLLSPMPSTVPPFYTSLPTETPARNTPSPSSKPSSKAPTMDSPKLFSESQAGKAGKATTPKTKRPKIAPTIVSPSYNPSVGAPHKVPTSSPVCTTAKWHPNRMYSACTNSLDFPTYWTNPELEPHFFHATLQQCCENLFGATGVCDFEDVCIASPNMPVTDSPTEKSTTQRPSQSPSVEHLIQSPTLNPVTTSTQVPSSSPSSMDVDTLPPSGEVLPLVGTSQPTLQVKCNCPSNDMSERPSFQPSLHTSPPTSSPESPSILYARSTGYESTVRSQYELDAKEVESSDFNGFVVTSQKETLCSTVVEAGSNCKLQCSVTISLYHGDVLIREPMTDTYTANCSDDTGKTVSTRSLEMKTLHVDKMEELEQVHGG